MTTARGADLQVERFIARRSGSVTYMLNCRSYGNEGRLTVFQSRHGPLSCMNPACAGVQVEGSADPRFKGCEHTRCVRRYIEEHGEPEEPTTQEGPTT